LKDLKMKGRRVRLFLRLTTDVNDRLRALTRYHGELSRYIDDALTSLDLASIELMPVTLASAVTSKPANDGHPKTGQRN
jgi:hypothetical protein